MPFILWFGAKTCWARAGAGYRGVYDVPLLLCEDGDQVLQGGEAVQRRTARGGFVEAHAHDENAGDASAVSLSAAQTVEARHLSFAYDGGEPVFEDLSSAEPGDIGVTGPVAVAIHAGMRVLCERPYGIGAHRRAELSDFALREIAAAVGYSAMIRNFGTIRSRRTCSAAMPATPRRRWQTALDGEVKAMEQGAQTVVGSSGVRLSGGQAQRLALARTLAHPRPVLVLDDPFSALDRQTEDKVFANLKAYARDKVVILISHRLYHFPEMKQIVFMEDGKTTVGTHETLRASVPAYRSLYESQTGGVDHEA
ncbi:MAG: ATP-binding cassette domain-containing protein [Christensenellales bacterium]